MYQKNIIEFLHSLSVVMFTAIFTILVVQDKCCDHGSLMLGCVCVRARVRQRERKGGEGGGGGERKKKVLFSY